MAPTTAEKDSMFAEDVNWEAIYANNGAQIQAPISPEISLFVFVLA